MIIGITGKIGSGKDTAGQIIRWIQSSHLRELWEDDLEHFITRGHLYDHQSNWEIKKWADTLKDIVCMLIGCTREQIEDREFKERPLGEEWWYYKIDDKMYGTNDPYVLERKDWNWDNCPIIKLTPRLMLQLLGTEGGRKVIHPNIWVNALMSQYKPEMKIKEGTQFDINGVAMTEGSHGIQEFPNWIITDTRFPNEVEAINQRNGIIINIQRPETDHLAGTHESETALDNYDYNPYVIVNDGDIFHLTIKIEKLLKELNLVSL